VLLGSVSLYMLSATMLSNIVILGSYLKKGIMLSVVILSVIIVSVCILKAIKHCVIRLNVVAPIKIVVFVSSPNDCKK
jgi:hypothetical protein